MHYNNKKLNLPLKSQGDGNKFHSNVCCENISISKLNNLSKIQQGT